MLAWRILKAKHAVDPLSGEGARLHGGRWNHKGIRLVYCASSLSLAALEVLVNVDHADAPGDLVKVCVEIPDALPARRLTSTDLPAGWNDPSGSVVLKDLGGQWIADASEAVLIVPSAVIPEERAILINPAHPDTAKIQVISSLPFAFDARLKKP